MTLTVDQHAENWDGTIEAGDSIQIYVNGSPVASTLVTVQTGHSAKVYFKYNIIRDGY